MRLQYQFITVHFGILSSNQLTEGYFRGRKPTKCNDITHLAAQSLPSAIALQISTIFGFGGIFNMHFSTLAGALTLPCVVFAAGLEKVANYGGSASKAEM